MSSIYRSCSIKTILITSAVFLSGCAGLGVAVRGNYEAAMTNPRINVEKGGLWEGGSKPWLKSEDLLKYWGVPDRTEQTDTRTQLWRYNFEIRWNGIGVLVVIVPIPLIVPVGRDYIEFRIENDWVVSARSKEDSWIAMYGCVTSGIPHAAGTECHFGVEPDSGRGQRFLHKPHSVYKTRVVNGTDSAVTIIHTTRNIEANRFVEDRFILEPRQSRHILSNGHGEEIAVITVDGKKTARRPGEDFFIKDRRKDSSIVYLIADNRIISVPVKYWDNWETHLQEIMNMERTSR
ncbi:MAG: hypothetical protein OEQ18_07355 [Gammaproteobacteria bacterium]|nr:hypothetical protein [Gammaproteobacteria bacterium]